MLHLFVIKKEAIEYVEHVRRFAKGNAGQALNDAIEQAPPYEHIGCRMHLLSWASTVRDVVYKNAQEEDMQMNMKNTLHKRSFTATAAAAAAVGSCVGAITANCALSSAPKCNTSKSYGHKNV